MAGIFTEHTKKQMLLDMVNSFADSATRYYLAIGKSDEWNDSDAAPTPVNSEKEIRDFRNNIQSILRTTDVSFVTPRYNWTTGTTYQAYDDSKTKTNNGSYYVITDTNRVYICLRQGKTDAGVAVSSTVSPDSLGTSTSAGKLADGYVWKYLYTVSSLNQSKFVSANYMPVTYIDSAETGLTTIETAQRNVQNASLVGSIVGYRLVNGGTGYASKPTATIIGDGDSAEVFLTFDSSTGSILKATVRDSGSSFWFGSGYSFAEVSIADSATTQAVIKPIISVNGIGADARDDLRANALMFNAQPNGTQDGNFLVDQDFRQIGLVKNPTYLDSAFTGTAALALDNMEVTSVSGFTSENIKDSLIRGTSSGAGAYADDLDGAIIYYHQNDATGFTPFSEGEQIYDSDNPSRVGTIIAGGLNQGEIDKYSGTLMYIENRSPVLRDAQQTEDIKFILQL